MRDVARRLGIGAPHLCRLDHGTRVPSRTAALALIALYDLEQDAPDDARRLFALAAPTLDGIILPIVAVRCCPCVRRN